MKPDETFREYVTSGAFVLTLTKRHIQALGAIYHNNEEWYKSDRLSVMNTRSLESRGLIKWRREEPPPKSWLKARPSQWSWGMWTDPGPAYWDSQPFNAQFCLTEAGIRVVELLIIAQLIKPHNDPVPVFGRKELYICQG